MTQATYPDAFCVKCGTHTETKQKYTVVLASNARAVKGVCPQCASNVFKIVPKAKDFTAPKAEAPAAAQAKYPDCFCLKCQKLTETLESKTVVLENASRALTGKCKDCGSDVYRIMSPSQKAALQALKSGDRPVASAAVRQAVAAPDRRLQAPRRIYSARHAEYAQPNQWAFVAAAASIIAIIAAFFVYAVV